MIDQEREDASPMVKQVQGLEKKITILMLEQANLLEDVSKLVGNQFKEIENDMSGYDERIIDLENISTEKRLIALEQHKNYQIDENRAESKQIDHISEQVNNQFDAIEDLTKKVDDLQEAFNCPHSAPEVQWINYEYLLKENKVLQNRMENLESLLDVEKIQQIILDGANLHATILKFEARMKEVERFQDVKHEQYQKVIKNRVPHCCPVCSGSGKKMICDKDLKLAPITLECPACDSAGIVWG